MKTLLKIIAGLVVAGICCGFLYTQLKPEENIETRWFVETVHTGDTFNNIVEHYYDSSIKANKSWDEWQTAQKLNNESLFRKGRALQPGDKVLIVTKVRVAK